MPPRILESIQVAAERLEINPRTIRRRIADGTLTGYRVGVRELRVDPAEVDELLVQVVPTVGGVA